MHDTLQSKKKINLSDRWSFSWPTIDVLISGKSSIDMPALDFSSWQETTNFMLGYGYDPDDARDQKYIHAVFVESMKFIERYLLSFEKNPKLYPPDSILHFEDIRNLLLFASGCRKADELTQCWACAILRVMHTIAHLEGVERRIGIKEAKHQIEERFRRYLFRNDQGQLLFGEDDYVLLDRVEWKIPKSRESIILKLLHKRANVAETIYDLLGIRIVTQRLSDVMRTVKLIQKYNMVTFANCNPSRSRNNLVDLDQFRKNVEMLLEMLETGKVSETEFEAMIERITEKSGGALSAITNPHSASSYRSIQLTCRQLVRQRNPACGWITKLQELCEDDAMPEPRRKFLGGLLGYIDSWPGVRAADELFSFYPFEVQIIDKHTYDEIQSGDASHRRYKQSQIRAARRRVLADLLKVRK